MKKVDGSATPGIRSWVSEAPNGSFQNSAVAVGNRVAGRRHVQVRLGVGHVARRAAINGAGDGDGEVEVLRPQRLRRLRVDRGEQRSRPTRTTRPAPPRRRRRRRARRRGRHGSSGSTAVARRGRRRRTRRRRGACPDAASSLASGGHVDEIEAAEGNDPTIERWQWRCRRRPGSARSVRRPRSERRTARARRGCAPRYGWPRRTLAAAPSTALPRSGGHSDDAGDRGTRRTTS